MRKLILTALWLGATAALAQTTQGPTNILGNLGVSGTASAGQFTGPGTGLTGTAAALNVGGTAAGLSGTPALPNGTTATTQAVGDNSTKVETTAGTLAKIAASVAASATNVAGGAAGEILYQSAAGATAFSAVGTTGQSAVSGGTSAPTFSDLWLPEKIVPANCNNATAGNGMSLPTANAPTAVCRTGTYVQTGYLQFTASDSAQWQDEVPGDWDSANGPYVRVNYTQAAATASQSIIYTIAAVCSATVDDTVWPAVQTFATTTTGSTINTQYAQTLQLNSTTMANCAAGKMINFQMVTVTWPHKTPGVAEAN